MSVNCITCGKNRRDGLDLMCGECRAKTPPNCPRHRQHGRMVYADGNESHHDVKVPHFRCEFWVGSGVCGATLPLGSDRRDWLDRKTRTDDAVVNAGPSLSLTELLPYARHMEGCAANATTWRTADGPPACDCGLAALLARPPAAGGAEA